MISILLTLTKENFLNVFLRRRLFYRDFPDDFLCMVAGLSKMSLKEICCYYTDIKASNSISLYTN